MRRHAWIAIACCAALACSKSEEKKVSSETPPARMVSACDTVPLEDLIQQHPIHVLLGAADVIDGASVICDSTFKDWATFEPEHLPDQTSPAKLEVGLERVCAMLDAMPPSEQSRAAAGIASWVAASLAIAQVDMVQEYIASAVVRVPEVRSAIPEEVIARVPDEMVGYSMASAEFTAMNYRLTHILARMPEAERIEVLDKIYTAAAEIKTREEK